ncbi:MAG: cytochrome c oxidase subunit 3 [Burkholderiales bacterium]|nr:cytochrome c oxidase subunit 3 [Burkholderiales bacterium]
MSAPAAHGSTPDYFIPQPSSWPIKGSIALFLMALGAATWINGMFPGPWALAIGLAFLVYMLFGWFGTVAGESEGGRYSGKVDVSFRWSMSWFIFSEVMFFAAFFGALYYARVFSVPWLGDLDQRLLWPDFKAQWPTAGPEIAESFTPMGPFWIPTINTALLLSSGVTLTIAHHALKDNKRGVLNLFMFLTILLGVVFLGFQAYEYAHAYSDLNLKLSTGIYGSTFFMLTGFHGFHVTVGAIMLIVVWVRCMKGHFKPDHHFAFEGAAWYWHFVDVVWLGLYIVVYWM